MVVACWVQTWSRLSDKKVDVYPQKGIKSFTKLLAVPSAINSAEVTANMSARQLIKRSVKTI